MISAQVNLSGYDPVTKATICSSNDEKFHLKLYNKQNNDLKICQFFPSNTELLPHLIWKVVSRYKTSTFRKVGLMKPLNFPAIHLLMCVDLNMAVK